MVVLEMTQGYKRDIWTMLKCNFPLTLQTLQAFCALVPTGQFSRCHRAWCTCEINSSSHQRVTSKEPRRAPSHWSMDSTELPAQMSSHTQLQMQLTPEMNKNCVRGMDRKLGEVKEREEWWVQRRLCAMPNRSGLHRVNSNNSRLPWREGGWDSRSSPRSQCRTKNLASHTPRPLPTKGFCA